MNILVGDRKNDAYSKESITFIHPCEAGKMVEFCRMDLTVVKCYSALTGGLKRCEIS